MELVSIAITPRFTLNWIVSICQVLIYGSNRFVCPVAGSVEYTDCISSEAYNTPNECPGYESKNMMVRFQE